MTISDEAVEAAARWLWERVVDEYQRPRWGDAANDLVWNAMRKDTLVDARELLEAAAPHLMSAAWERGRVDGYHHRPNPYKETA